MELSGSYLENLCKYCCIHSANQLRSSKNQQNTDSKMNKLIIFAAIIVIVHGRNCRRTFNRNIINNQYDNNIIVKCTNTDHDKPLCQAILRFYDVSDELMPIANYFGDNRFLNDIREKLLKYGRLSDRQIEAALNQIEKEKGVEETQTEDKSYVDLLKEIQNYFVQLLREKVDQSNEEEMEGELSEYARTLKNARRQNVGIRFPKSAVKANPYRFKK